METVQIWWSSWYHSVPESWHPYLPQVGGFIAMMVTYWTYGLILLATDITKKPQWIQNRRHQKARPFAVEATSYNPALSDLLTNVLTNQFFVILPGLFVLQAFTTKIGLGIIVSEEIPSLSTMIFHTIAGSVAVEIAFFYSHWLLHHPMWYSSVHKIHHRYKAPTALASMYAHPIEALIGDTLCVMGPAFFLKFHLFEWFLGVFVGWIYTCNGHCGYSLPWRTGRNGGFQDFHDYHHEIFTGNYGSIGFMDRLHGTDTQWRAHCEKVKQLQSEKIDKDA